MSTKHRGSEVITMYVPYYGAIMPSPTYAPDIYAERCISRKRHVKRRMRQYGRV